MMEQDLIKAKKYLIQQGYGSGTNYTANLVAVLLANYAQEQVKKFRLADVVGQSQQFSCSCGIPPAIRLCEGVESCLKCGEKLSK